MYKWLRYKPGHSQPNVGNLVYTQRENAGQELFTELLVLHGAILQHPVARLDIPASIFICALLLGLTYVAT